MLAYVLVCVPVRDIKKCLKGIELLIVTMFQNTLKWAVYVLRREGLCS